MTHISELVDEFMSDLGEKKRELRLSRYERSGVLIGSLPGLHLSKDRSGTIQFSGQIKEDEIAHVCSALLRFAKEKI